MWLRALHKHPPMAFGVFGAIAGTGAAGLDGREDEGAGSDGGFKMGFEIVYVDESAVDDIGNFAPFCGSGAGFAMVFRL